MRVAMLDAVGVMGPGDTLTLRRDGGRYWVATLTLDGVSIGASGVSPAAALTRLGRRVREMRHA